MFAALDPLSKMDNYRFSHRYSTTTVEFTQGNEGEIEKEETWMEGQKLGPGTPGMASVKRTVQRGRSDSDELYAPNSSGEGMSQQRTTSKRAPGE